MLNHTTSTPGAAPDAEQANPSVANPRRTRVAADGTPIVAGSTETAN